MSTEIETAAPSASTVRFQGATVPAPEGAPREFKLPREGDRPVKFRGWRLGEGNHGTGGNSGYESDHTRGTRVRVYLTTGGNLVIGVYRWSRWQGEGATGSAAVCGSAEAALAWLREDCGGELGAASLEAWAPLEAEAAEEVA